jgi:hypothetical protein
MIKEYIRIGLFIGWFIAGVVALKNSFAGYYPRDNKGRLMLPLDYFILIWLAYLTTFLVEGL